MFLDLNFIHLIVSNLNLMTTRNGNSERAGWASQEKGSGRHFESLL